MYTEIRKITGNNKGYAAAALAKTIEECWWITGDEGNIVYLRTKENDWVAIPDVYYDEGTEFTTVGGASVVLTSDKNYNYVGLVAE